MRRRINEVARFTRQPHALAAFYASLLGRPAPGREREVFAFDVEGVRLFIHPTGDDPPQPGWPPNVDHLSLEVEDLDAECERLAAAGHTLLGPSEFPWGRSAYLHDPDGRMVELQEPETRNQ